jgi:predicted lactoylglutathione lyase
MLGRFLEISITTQDIRASVEFYEAIGFSACTTGDMWPHPYGVLTDGRICIGLHQYRFPSPALTFVRPHIARHTHEFTALGIELAFAKTAEDAFNEIGFRDPAGQMLTILEARTFSANERKASEVSRCGWFSEFSLPCNDFAIAKQFWEKLGFVALDESDVGYINQPLTGDGLSLTLHRPRTLDRPMLVFRESDMRERLAALRDLDVPFSAELPRGLDPAANALLEAPEGTALLLLEDT